jgi:hypothetical protein
MVRRLALVVGISCVVASGCAFGDRYVVELSYPPAGGPPPPAGNEGIEPGPPRPARPVTVALQDFTDVRSKAPIGEVRNGFGMHTADVLPLGHVDRWVTEAIEYELTAAGLRVERLQGRRPMPGQTVISGKITIFYCRALFSYESEVAFIGQVAVGNRVDFTGHLSGNGDAGVNLAATEVGYGECLAAGLQDAARKFVKQIYPVLIRRPLPAPPESSEEVVPPQS